MRYCGDSPHSTGVGTVPRVTPNRVCRAHDVHHFGHRVHAHDVRAEQHDGRYRRRSAPVALVGVPLAERRFQERLAGGADQHGPAERLELPQAGQQGQAVFRALGEADAGIDQDSLALDARRFGERQALPQFPGDLAGNVDVSRLAIHLTGPATVVHQHHRRAPSRHNMRQGRIIP